MQYTADMSQPECIRRFMIHSFRCNTVLYHLQVGAQYLPSEDIPAREHLTVGSSLVLSAANTQPITDQKNLTTSTDSIAPRWRTKFLSTPRVLNIELNYSLSSHPVGLYGGLKRPLALPVTPQRSLNSVKVELTEGDGNQNSCIDASLYTSQEKEESVE